MNPSPDTNNAQLQQDYSTGGDEPIGTWLIPGDQIDSYTFICQSPKVPKSEEVKDIISLRKMSNNSI